MKGINPMLRTTLGVVSAVVIISGVAFGINKSQKNKHKKDTTTSNTQTVTTVSYDGTKFSPAEITINLGTTISFVNNSPNELQISSENKGFGSDKVLNKGEGVNFTFTSKGKFTYTNGKSTTQTGIVTVL